MTPKKIVKHCFLVFIVIFSINSTKTNAQNRTDDFSYSYIDILYGVVYQPQNYNALNHQFFLNEDVNRGKINFQGNEIDNVYLKYDLFNQTLVLYQDFDPSKSRFISLNSDRIEEFSIYQNDKVHEFISNKKYSNLSEDIIFYKIEYSNKVDYLIGYVMLLNEAVDGNKNKFILNEKHYIVINNNAVEFKSKNELFDVLSLDKKTAKKFIKKNKLKIRLKNTEQIIKLIQYYEESNP